MNDFISIAITHPEFYKDESSRISFILESGEADFVHIRKPAWSIEQVRSLIESIPKHLHPRLKIHDHFNLINEYELGGIHLNFRNPEPPDYATIISKSYHNVEQLSDAGHYIYVTLSPIFDSISKKGYQSRFNLTELSPFIRGKNVVALGGVTPERFPELKKAGFIGAAMLGHFFNH